MSPQFKLTAVNVMPILKVLVYSGLSAVVVAAIAMLESTEIAPQYVLLVPVVNSVLYALKEFFTVRVE